MKSFIDEDFLLQSRAARILYHDYAEDMPIFDYHCHLPPKDIAENKRFENLTQIWLSGDHYKWRAMRTNGIAERYITGDASDEEKFMAWAETVPYTVRNPLYHWTHLELKNPFGVAQILAPETAKDIYTHCNKLLQTDKFRTRGLMEHFRVKFVCTTDDPTDDLVNHVRIQNDQSFKIKVVPTFRPDKAMQIENPTNFNVWVDKLGVVTDLDIQSVDGLIGALRKRVAFFHDFGCRISDQAVEAPYATEYTSAEVEQIFTKVRRGTIPEGMEILKFKSAMMHEFALMYAEKNWAMQIHIGALRNNNSRMMKLLGPDTGFDAIADYEIAYPLSRFLDRLDREGKLPKTILYVLNPKDNEVIGTIIGCFQDGTFPGKIQFGSGWWFNDQKDGMERQIEALSQLGLLSRFVGMLTDSRSFLSYPRHEYFRRILCNKIGKDVENGELPNDLNWLGKIIQDISFNNAERYFGIVLNK